ncbi:hypothetical protein [Streptomyces sp. NBC_00154]|uniref:hypothetical protein n=1 Tax=Streptomyces sp. NBC_00154 TaxID=2975670 RepID=UPI00224D67AA|nr:hypothetical protein [Streptomyces sp. NBC_00154]
MPTPYGAGPAAGDAASGAARPLLPRGVRGEVRPGGGGKGEGGDGEVRLGRLSPRRTSPTMYEPVIG